MNTTKNRRENRGSHEQPGFQEMMNLILVGILLILFVQSNCFAESVLESSSLVIQNLNFTVNYPSIFYEPYSFTNEEWRSVDTMLLKSHRLCIKNTTWFLTWTKPIKCSYYLIILALSDARKLNVPEQITSDEKQHIESLVDAIYGSKDAEKFTTRIAEVVKTETSLSPTHKRITRQIIQTNSFEELSTCIDQVDSINDREEKRVAIILTLSLEMFQLSVQDTMLDLAGNPFFQHFLRYLELLHTRSSHRPTYQTETNAESDTTKDEEDNDKSQWTIIYGLYIAFQEPDYDHPYLQTFLQHFGGLLGRSSLFSLYPQIKIQLLPYVPVSTQTGQAMDGADMYFKPTQEHPEALPYFLTYAQYELVQVAMIDEFEYFTFFTNLSEFVFHDPSTAAATHSTAAAGHWLDAHISHLVDRNEIFPNFGLAITPLQTMKQKQQQQKKQSYAFTFHRQHLHMIETMKRSNSYWKILETFHYVHTLTGYQPLVLREVTKDEFADLYVTFLVYIYDLFQSPLVPFPSKAQQSETSSSKVKVDQAEEKRFRKEIPNWLPTLPSSITHTSHIKAPYRVLIERYRRYIAQYLHLQDDYRIYHQCLLSLPSASEMINELVVEEAQRAGYSEEFASFQWSLSQLSFLEDI